MGVNSFDDEVEGVFAQFIVMVEQGDKIAAGQF